MTEADVHEEVRHEEEDLHETETKFDLVDLDQQNDYETSLIIKEKDAQIRELQSNLDRSKFVIYFLEQENNQLQTKQTIVEMQLLKEKREENKAKVLLDEAYDRYGEPNEEEDKVPRKRPRTRGLKRALE